MAANISRVEFSQPCFEMENSMKRKFWKKGLAFTMALTLALGESSSVLAAESAQTMEQEISEGDAWEFAASGEVSGGDDAAPGEQISGGDGAQVPGEEADKPGDGVDISAGDVSGNVPESSGELDDMFPGLTEAYAIDADAFSDKEVLGQYTEEWSETQEGVDYAAEEILVNAETEDEAKAYADAFNGTLTDYFSGIAVITLNADDTLPKASVWDAVYASSLEEMALPAAWPNYYRHTDSYNDPLLSNTISSYQWYHSPIHSQLAWGAGYEGSHYSNRVKVAVLDTGVTEGHEDLQNINTIDIGLGTVDNDGHGTHMCGIIGAVQGNSLGGVGIAPECRIYSVKVTEKEGEADTASILKGLEQATASPYSVDIVNISLGGSGYSQIEEEAYRKAAESGVAVFCAAGNNYGNSLDYPAAYKDTVAVAALNKSLGRADFSSYGTGVCYCAPGVDIYSTTIGGTSAYEKRSGTSCATAIVTGEAAIIYATLMNTDLKGKKSAQVMLEKMDKACVKVSGTGTGKGYVDLAKVLGLTGTESAPRKPVISQPSGTILDESVLVTIESPDPDCTIYYSTDGKTVTYKNGKLSNNATLYPGGNLKLYGPSVTLYAIAVKNSNQLASPAACARYTFKPKVSFISIKSASGGKVLAPGSSLSIKTFLDPVYAVKPKITWTIQYYDEKTGIRRDNDPKKTGVSISASGKITATKNAVPRDYRILAETENGRWDDLTVTVCSSLSNPTTSITAKQKTFTLKRKDSVTINFSDITLTRKDRTKVDGHELTWYMDYNKIAGFTLEDDAIVVEGKYRPGTVKLYGTAADGSGKSIVFTFVVKQEVTGIDIPGDPVIRVSPGKTVNVGATAQPSNAANKKLIYKLYMTGQNGASVEIDTKETGLSVSAGGQIKAAKNAKTGSYYLRITPADGSNVTRQCLVFVAEADEEVTRISVEQKNVVLFRVDNGAGSANEVSIPVSSNFDWEVTGSTSKIAEAKKGRDCVIIKATGNSTGTANVILTPRNKNGKSVTIKVTVKNPPSSLRIAPQSGRSDYVAKGTTLQLVPVLETAYGKVNAESKKLVWSSSNPKYVKVDGNGRVTGLVSGGTEVVITAKTTDGSNLTATYTIKTCSKIKEIRLYGVDKKSKTITLNQGLQCSYMVFWSEVESGYASESYDVKVSREGITASYQPESGKIYITANKKGTYTLTVSSNDGSSAKTTYKVIVN